MADILSQEEIDALLQVVDDDGNGHSANIPEHTESLNRLLYTTLNAQIGLVKSN